MDRYTKAILTLIAVALVMIALKMWEPREAYSISLGGGPTLGQIQDAYKINDLNKRGKQIESLVKDMPVVYIWKIRK